MKGIDFVVSSDGARKAVVIDLSVNGDLWEDFYDAALAEDRKNEPRESLAEVRELLSATGKQD